MKFWKQNSSYSCLIRSFSCSTVQCLLYFVLAHHTFSMGDCRRASRVPLLLLQSLTVVTRVECDLALAFLFFLDLGFWPVSCRYDSARWFCFLLHLWIKEICLWSSTQCPAPSFLQLQFYLISTQDMTSKISENNFQVPKVIFCSWVHVVIPITQWCRI